MKLSKLSAKLHVPITLLLGYILSACGGQSSISPESNQTASAMYSSITVSKPENKPSEPVEQAGQTNVTAAPHKTLPQKNIQRVGTFPERTITSLSTSTVSNPVGTTSTTSTTSTIDAPISGAIASIKIENTGPSEQASVPITFGHVFVPGNVPQASSLTGKLSDGTAVPLQVNAKASHPDGSLRHAIISAVIPKVELGQTQKLGLIPTSDPASQSAASPTDLLNAGFTASVNINLGGQIYGASADALLKAGKYTTWIAGPIATEWLVSSPLKNAQGVEHPHLTARFAVRSYSGLNKAKVDVIVENNWAYVTSPQNFSYDAQIIVGGKPVYSTSALTHYHHARWRKTFWWGIAPQVHLKHDSAYLIASKAVPNYDRNVIISDATLTSIRSKFTGAVTEPMRNGLAMAYMPNTGGRQDIGLLPGWAVAYLLSMDKDAKAATLGMGDLAGSWSAHYRDKATDRPVSLINYPYMTINGRSTDTYNPVTKKYEAFPVCGGTCTNPNQADTAHQPSFSYLPYIVTGDHYYLEELQFWAMWNLFQSNPGYRDNIKGLFHSTQVRGQAWILRTLADAAYITPDKDPLKTQFETFLSNNLDWYNNTYSNNSTANNSLGAFTDQNAAVYDNGTGIAPWQDDFFTSAAGHAAELGFSKAKPLLAWKAKFPVSRMVGPGYCWILGSTYSLRVKDSSTSPVYTSISRAYTASNPSNLTSLTCASAEMAATLGLKVGEMVGYSQDNLGFPSNLQPALAYSVDAGIPSAAQAWTVFMNRSVKPNYSLGAQFAIIPR